MKVARFKAAERIGVEHLTLRNGISMRKTRFATLRPGIRKLGYVLILAICSLPTSASGQDQATHYHVVPPSWITQDKNNPEDRTTAYVFPSLRGTDAAGPLEFSVPEFFLRRNRFHTPRKPFRWSASEKTVQITVRRTEKESTVNISIADSAGDGSMTSIRRLSWEQFHDLQDSFRSWLCGRSGLWLFEECESRFSNLQRDLNTIWKDRVLAQATFKRFADAYLNTTTSTAIAYTGKVSSILKNQTGMFATRIVPGQSIVVSWGNDNLYPATSLLDSYSRITSGGQTEIRVVASNGMRLFPVGSCAMVGDFQVNNTAPTKGILPFPPDWANLFATEFIPIYNLFDLHNSALLAVSGAMPPADCNDSRKGPDYLFLLSPAAYRKPDMAPTGNIAQFENEARPGFYPSPTQATARDELNMLARQFLIVGCNSPKSNGPPDQFKAPDQLAEWDKMDDQHKLLADLNGEWDHLLEKAFESYKYTSPDAPTSSRPCGNFVNGLFAGKSFVELRHQFSINGHPVEFGALNLQTIGQVLGGSYAASLNRKGHAESSPLIELLRSTDIGNGIDAAGVLRIRFYTTVSTVLDQANIFEGDEIRVSPIPEDLH